MAKIKTRFICQNCGAISPSWLGKCPECDEWNSYEEEKVSKKQSTKTEVEKNIKSKGAVLLEDVKYDDTKRDSSKIPELDIVLGGGIVKGSLVLVGGDPGIGKSTLLIQMAISLSNETKIMYVSGEESPSQIKMRASRISSDYGKVLMLAETEIKSIFSDILKHSPQILVIDSIQTMFDEEIDSAPGSVSQIREITHQLMLIAKKMGISIFIVGHVTKSGNIAGPKILEHMVDTVLYFEGDQNSQYRILRSVKNRFGAANEIGVFEMSSNGLKGVKNPSKLFIENKPKNTSGSVITACMEGTRPILIEVQALTSYSVFPSPRRVSTGVEHNKLNILIAVMNKICGIDLNNIDVYINLVGGISISEPAIDLSIALAIRSIHSNIPIADDLVVFGEVGLTGEIRGVNNSLTRVSEAIRLGFKDIIMPETNVTPEILKMNANIIKVKNLKDVFSIL